MRTLKQRLPEKEGSNSTLPLDTTAKPAWREREPNSRGVCVRVCASVCVALCSAHESGKLIFAFSLSLSLSTALGGRWGEVGLPQTTGRDLRFAIDS